MRATSTVVVFSSLAIAVSAAAGPNDKANDKATDKKAPATTTASKAPATGAPAPATPAASGDTTPAPSPDVATVRPEDMPTAVRMRRLEQKTQALKERAWQLK